MRCWIPLLLSLSLCLVSSVFAQVTELPTWQAGEEWAWGGSYDLNEILSSVFQQLVESGVVGNWEGGGRLDSYGLMRVESIEDEHYRTSLKSGMLLNLKVSLIPPAASPEVAKLFEARIHGAMRANGTMLLTRQLALERMEITIRGDFAVNMKGGGFEWDIRGSDFWLSLSIAIDEPLNLLNFPITVGENWKFQSTVHAFCSIKGQLQGKIVTPDYENSFSERIGWDNAFDMFIQGFCQCTGVAEMDIDGVKDNCFEIEVQEFSQGASQVLPLTFRVYYSPVKKNLVAFEMDWSDFLLTMESALEPAVRKEAMVPDTYEEIKGALRSASETETLRLSYHSPQEVRQALAKIETTKKEISWVLVAVPVIIVASIVLVKRFY
jgi:hypothetical protein